MGIFKKKVETSEYKPRTCDHKWTDIRIDGEECWYVDSILDGNKVQYSIIEPYVCIHCKQRKDVVLAQQTTSFTTKTAAYDYYDKLRKDLKKQYPQIKDRAIVEDKISDVQLVDRDYLRVAAMVLGLKL